MSRALRRLRAAAGALVLLLSPAALLGQRVSGQVKLPGGATGGGGVIVVAQDSAGTEVLRVVTSDDGRYALPLPRAGYTRVVLERVGYERTVALEQAVAAGEIVSLDPTLGASVRVLPLRSSVAPSSCGNSAVDQTYVATLMDEVRKAITAAHLTSTRQGVVARWAVTDHRLAANARDTARFLIARRSGAPVAAFGTPVLGELQRSGYVVVAGKDRIFRGFDLTTLLSPWFASSYCFTAREGSATAFTVSFEPKERKRDYVDVEGTLLIERATMALQEINYRYVGLTSDEDKRDGGGRVGFARAAGGTWLVSDWFIRFPQVGFIELETFRSQDRARVLQPEVMGHELLSWQTTALLEGSRRIFMSEAAANDDREGPIRSACSERVIFARTGAARGRLTWQDRPVANSRIRATWRVAVDVGGEVPLWRDEIREAISSNRGDWVLCDLPALTTVELSWEVMGKKSSTSLRVDWNQLVTLDADGKPVP
ncbi:MAG: carboxypeptidase regulatory-like domain-containing protein [Gemmatimonadaceae bacterium]|nr:carboxypeptidase regulatory-like domain-containing protein [Gemmatimonadaceae bacterium]